MANCTLCPVECGADREKNAGRCGVKGLTVAKYYLHPYEEPPICHTNGSGAIFFGGCHLRCAFCQNYEVSRGVRGKEISPSRLCEIFRELEKAGADNINLVTPDHVSHLILQALREYKPSIPVIYNTSGYCKTEALQAIDRYIDVYLPDVKFYSSALAVRYTGRADYFDRAEKALAFMAQKPVVWDGDKLLSGMLVRHLVMPMCVSDTLKILDFLRETLPAQTPLSLMRQYVPMGEAERFPELCRGVTDREYRRAEDHALLLGFSRLYTQTKESAQKKFIPDWED